MLLFRSEEHLEWWRDSRGLARGGTLTVEQCWSLATAWYTDRQSRDWRRRTADEARGVFESLGLTGPFWDLPT